MKKILSVIYLLSLLSLLSLFGCSNYADLYSERKILKKTTTNDGVTKYELNNDTMYRFYKNGIWADNDFAKVGDIVKCENGVIKVITKKEK